MAPKAEAQMFLDALAALELPPFETLDVATQRALFDAKREDAPAPPDIHETYDRTVAGPGGDIPIRVVRPSDAENLPVIVFFHGGGWVIGTLDSHDPVCRALANAASAVVVSVDYRRAPEHRYPAAFDDCFAVTKWVADNSGDLRVDSSRLAVGGDSAGGNLAAAVALAARDAELPVSSQLLVYPVTNQADPETDSYAENGAGYLLTKGWMSWFTEQYIPDPELRRERNASPALAESHTGVAPAMIVTAEFDPLRDDGANYAEMLRSAGVDVDYRMFDGQIHGFASQIGVMADAMVNVDALAAFASRHW